MSGLVLEAVVEHNGFRLSVSLDVALGETVAIVGPNGAGKSTLVRAVTGLTPITGGRVELAGQVVDEPASDTFVPPHERSIGAAFQDALLFPHLSVAANVGFRIRERRRRLTAADAWLERVGLSGFGDRRPSELSGGEARRVAIARALIDEPALVILDEPFAGLDAAATVGVRRMLVDQVGEVPGARLIVTHDPVDAQALADRVVVLEAGAVTQTGTPDDIRRRPATKYVADLVGLNLVHGIARDGRVQVDGTDLELAVANRTLSGGVTLTIEPHAVSLHGDQPAGSPRNTWTAEVGGMHQLGDVVRVQFDAPVPLVVDVTPGAVRDLGLAPGRSVWLAVKATSLDARARPD